MWDGPRVGRGNMSCEAYTIEPVIGQDQRNWVAWRFGPAAGQWFEHVQFPKSDAAAMDRAMAARYAEFDIAKNAHLEASAAAKALDQIGPAVLVTNSAGDWRGILPFGLTADVAIGRDSQERQLGVVQGERAAPGLAVGQVLL